MSKLRNIFSGPRLAILFILIGVLVLAVVSRLSAPLTLDFLAGPRGSTFYQDATRYKEMLQVHGITVNIIETAGTVENLQRILKAEVPTAAFGDAVQGIREEEEEILQEEAAPGEEIEESELEEISSLGAMYLQPLWIFAHKDTSMQELKDLRGHRLGSGWEGSSARMLAAIIMDSTGIKDQVELARINQEDENVIADEAIEALRSKRIYALLVMGQPDSPLIDGLLRTADIVALPMGRSEAYALHFPFLRAVRLPEGGYDLKANIPPQDLQMLAASSELLVSNRFPPALADVLLAAANDIHGEASLFSTKQEFPNPDMVSIPLNASAAHYYKEGPPLLHQVLPFRWATWIDRFFMVVVAFGSAAFALFSVVPKLIGAAFNRKLTDAYRQIEDIEKSLNQDYDREAVLAELDELERRTAGFKVLMRGLIAPWMEMRQNLHDLRDRVAD